MNRLTSNPQAGGGRRVILMLLLATLVVRAECASAESDLARKRDDARRKIAAMTEAERTRLKTDFEKFCHLSDEKKAKLVQLDQEVQRDPDLKRTMTQYLEFLEPLSAGEVEDLRSETAPDRRAVLVRTMLKEQHDRAESGLRLVANRRGLGPADLDAVLGVLETHIRLQKLRTKGELEALEGKTGLARQVAILELAFSRPLAGDRASPPLFSPSSPSQPLLDDMVAAISDLEQRKRVARGNQRFRNLFWSIDAGISAEFDSQKPTEDVLGEFLLKLTGAQKSEILRLPVDQQQRALLRMYAETHPDQLPKPPSFRRWMFGGERGRRNSGQGRDSEGDGFRGPGRPEPGANPNPALPARRRRPNDRQEPDKPMN